MEEKFLEFCRTKIDFFDSQLFFFIKERIDTCNNLEIFFVKQKTFRENFYQKIQEINENRIYQSYISKEWFLDFLNFDNPLKTSSTPQKLSQDFFLPYLTSIDANIYFILQNRFLISIQIGLFKKKNNLAVVDSNRWQSLVQDRLAQAKKLHLPQTLVSLLLEKIHKYSVQLQKNYG